MDGDERHVVLDDEQAGAERVADAQRASGPSASASRWAMPRRRLVEQHDRRARGRARRPRSTTRRDPVDSSPTNFVAERLEAEQLDRARRPAGATASSRVDDARQAEGGVERVAHVDASARGRRRCVSSTVSAGNSRASWKRAAEPGRARWSGPSRVDVAPAEHDPPGRRARVKPEIRSNSVVLPAPFGPMSPTTSPGATVNDTSSTARMPPKRRPRHARRDRAARRGRRRRVGALAGDERGSATAVPAIGRCAAGAVAVGWAVREPRPPRPRGTPSAARRAARAARRSGRGSGSRPSP